MTEFRSLVSRLQAYYASAPMQVKLTIAFLTVSLSLLALLIYFNTRFVESALTTEANRALRVAAARTADDLLGFVSATQDAVRSEAQIPIFQDFLALPEQRRNPSREQISAIKTLRFFQSRNRWVQSYGILDTSGRVQLDTVTANIGRLEQEQAYFQVPTQSVKPYRSPVEVDPPGPPIFYLSAPILGHLKGRIDGVLRVKYDADIFQSLVAKQNELIGSGSFALLLNENRVCLAHGKDPQKRFAPIASAAPELAELLAGEQDVFAYRDEQGEVFQATRVALANDWTVAFFQPRHIFLSAAQNQHTFTLVLAGLGVLLIVVVAVAVARFIARPIVHLTEVAEAVTAGDHKARAELATSDEVGRLASAFNDMTGQLGHSIERLNDRAQQLRKINEIGQSLTRQLDSNELARGIVSQVGQHLNCHYVHLYRVDSENQTLLLTATADAGGSIIQATAGSIPLDALASAPAEAARNRQVAIKTASDDPHWSPNPQPQEVRSELAVPIVLDGEAVGVLSIQRDDVGNLDEADSLVLRSLAAQVAIAMRNAELFSQNQVALQEAKTLYAISQRMTASTSLTQLMRAMVEEINIPACNRAVLITFDYDRSGKVQAVEVRANWHSGRGPAPTEVGTRYRRADYSIVDLFFRSEPLFIDDIANVEHADNASIQHSKQLQIKAMAVLPLWSQGRQIGVLLLESERVYEFQRRDIDPYLATLGQLATEVENHRLLEQTQTRAVELAAARDAAEAANKAKSEFLSNMSHELRTPLNGVLGYARILARAPDLTPKQRQGLGVIRESGEHLLALITEVLDLSKIEAGKIELTLADFGLPQLLDGIAGIFRGQAEERGVAFDFRARLGSVAAVRADERQLRQVLINLLGNAIKFTEHGRVGLTVSLVDGPCPSGCERFRFDVADTGVGVEPTQLQRIFLPFEQTGSAQRRSAGTGLGLAISQKLVQLMGSELEVESTLGQGSRFWFDINLAVVSRAETPVESTLDQDVVGYRGERRTVLVVDDQSINRLILRETLEPLGFDVIEAANGQQAIEQATRAAPDAIIMDLVMPEMDGFQATQAIRQTPELRNVTILAASASAFEDDERRSLQAGCNGFLAKPIDADQLMRLLADHLRLDWSHGEGEQLS